MYLDKLIAIWLTTNLVFGMSYNTEVITHPFNYLTEPLDPLKTDAAKQC